MSDPARAAPRADVAPRSGWTVGGGSGVLAAVGLALLLGLVVHFGPERLLSAASRLGPRLGIVVLVPMLAIQACFLFGWWLCFRAPARRPRIGRLALAHGVGEAFNTLTLFANMGGELLKAQLLRPELALRDSGATLVVARTVRTAAQALFLGGGMLFALLHFSIELPLAVGLGGFAVALALGVVAFVLLQQRGLFSRLLTLLQRLGVPRSPKREAALRDLDANLRDHYRGAPGSLVFSLAIQLVGFALGALEVALVCVFLGEPISLTQALFTEVVGLGLATAFFFVPGGLGVTEGGRAAAFAMLGLDPATGFVVGVVRRLRDLAWAGAGLGLYAWQARRGGLRA